MTSGASLPRPVERMLPQSVDDAPRAKSLPIPEAPKEGSSQAKPLYMEGTAFCFIVNIVGNRPFACYSVGY